MNRPYCLGWLLLWAAISSPAHGADVPHAPTPKPSTVANAAALARPNPLPGATNGLSRGNLTNDAPAAAGVPTFTWKELLLPEYTNYLAKLRAAGCPEKYVRQIVVSDVTDFFDAKRLHEAIQSDFEWWKADGTAQRAWLLPAPPAYEQLRAVWLTKFLGSNWAETVKLPPIPANALRYHLTGPVLGALPLHKYSAAADICRQSEERLREYQTARFLQGQPLDPVEETRLRQQTRLELGQFLSPDEMEEFLLRNSHNAEILRQSLRGFNPTRDEFLKVFRALDPLQHQMQLDYGNEAALSARQREDYERQCDRAVQEVLPADRFKAYVLTRDPLYQRAQADVAQWALDNAALTPLYEFYRAQAGRREQVMKDPALSAEQKNAALQALTQEEQKKLADLVQAKRSGK
jgi:hypothetical protein